MKIVLSILLAVLIFATTVLAQSPLTTQVTSYRPSPDALHPFKLVSLVIRPPIALMSIFVEGAYWTLDSEPIRRGFDIDAARTFTVDEDY